MPALAQAIEAVPGVYSAEVRSAAYSIILHYDPNQLDPERLIGLVTERLRTASGMENPLDRSLGPAASLAVSRGLSGLPASVVGQLLEAAGLTLFLGYVLVRRLLFRSPLSQSPLSSTGVMACVGAVPLVHRSWTELRQRRRPGLFLFLTAACGLAIATGEALTALEITWVLSVGLFLEGYVTERARRAIRETLAVSPEKTYVLVEGVELEMPVTDVRQGDIVVVTSGDRIPVDGVVVSGSALVDEAQITGRSEAAFREPAQWVYAGTVLQQGRLQIRAEKLGEETYLARVVALIEQSLSRPAEIEKRADVLAVRLTRLGIAMTLVTLLVTRSVSRSLAVMLVMSCPCATVLAASTAVAAALAAAARHHILIKGGVYLEEAGRIDTFCIDKTGTITTDVPQIVEILPRTSRQDRTQLLELAAIAEGSSTHVMAKAVIKEAQQHGLVVAPGVTREVTLGRGVRAQWNSHLVCVGNADFLREQGLDPACFQAAAEQHMESGHTVIYVSRDGELQGMIALGNRVRPNADAVLGWLRRDGVERLCLISGDAQPVVRTLAHELGFDDYCAPLLPQQKADYVQALQADGNRVLMLGDGVNDALALSQARIGVAMGAGGVEAGIEAADIVLVKSDLEDLVRIRRLSRRTLRTIEQNFWIANTTNIVGAVAGLSGWLTPVLAGILHVAHSLGILLNSRRLLDWRIPEGQNERQ